MTFFFHRRLTRRPILWLVHRRRNACMLFYIVLALIFLSGCSPTKSVVVLLPDSEGRVGNIRVHSSQGTIQLEQAYQSATFETPSKSEPTSSTMGEQEIVAKFGDALKAEPEISTRLDIFTLYYERDSVDLTAESSRNMEAILASMKDSHVIKLFVIGHTDRLGSKRYNWRLSEQRALSMKDLLIGSGIHPDRIVVSFLGETDPLVETEDEVEQPLNRRVSIVAKSKIEK